MASRSLPVLSISQVSAVVCQPGWAQYSHTWQIHCANKSSGCWWPFWSGCHGNGQQMEEDTVWEVIKRRLSLNPYLASPNLMRFHGSRKNNHSPGLLWGPGSLKLSIRQLQVSFQEPWTHPKCKSWKFYEAFTRRNPVNHPGPRCGVPPQVARQGLRLLPSRRWVQPSRGGAWGLPPKLPSWGLQPSSIRLSSPRPSLPWSLFCWLLYLPPLHTHLPHPELSGPV